MIGWLLHETLNLLRITIGHFYCPNIFCCPNSVHNKFHTYIWTHLNSIKLNCRNTFANGWEVIASKTLEIQLTRFEPMYTREFISCRHYFVGMYSRDRCCRSFERLQSSHWWVDTYSHIANICAHCWCWVTLTMFRVSFEQYRITHFVVHALIEFFWAVALSCASIQFGTERW